MDDPFEKMKKKIKKATAFIIGVESTLILYLIYPKWFKELINLIPQWATFFVWIIPIIFTAIASYFVIFDIHNWFDKKIFKERKKVDNFIREQLTVPCREIKCDRATGGILKEEERKLMDLFYTFIPLDDTERIRAFHYWGDYFITVNLSMFSIFGFIIALIYVIILYFSQHLLKITSLSFIVLFILSLLFNLLRWKVKGKLLYPAKAQTRRILNEYKEELKDRLPNYRIGCKKCCPFIHRNKGNA